MTDPPSASRALLVSCSPSPSTLLTTTITTIITVTIHHQTTTTANDLPTLTNPTTRTKFVVAEFPTQ